MAAAAATARRAPGRYGQSTSTGPSRRPSVTAAKNTVQVRDPIAAVMWWRPMTVKLPQSLPTPCPCHRNEADDHYARPAPEGQARATRPDLGQAGHAGRGPREKMPGGHRQHKNGEEAVTAPTIVDSPTNQQRLRSSVPAAPNSSVMPASSPAAPCPPTTVPTPFCRTGTVVGGTYERRGDNVQPPRALYAGQLATGAGRRRPPRRCCPSTPGRRRRWPRQRCGRARSELRARCPPRLPPGRRRYPPSGLVPASVSNARDQYA